MTKAFKKGQQVTCISDWDHKGTVCVRHATVHSCGTKVLRLTCDVTGDEFGHEFSPVVAEPGRCGVRLRLDGETLDSEAMAVAKHVLDMERSHLTGCIARNASGPNPNAGYARVIEQDLSDLHEPRWAMYEVLKAEVAARVQQMIEARRREAAR